MTGGGNGLGREICIELAKHGCKVAIADIDIAGAEKTLKMMSKSVDSKVYRVDLSKKEEITELRQRVLTDFGDVDILVNNAGLMSFNTIFNESEGFIDKMVQVNLIAVILMSKVFLQDMIERKSGHIVTISSLFGIHHNAYGVSYGATKFGVNGFMMNLREFLRRQKLDENIQSTLIMPTAIATCDHVMDSMSKDYGIMNADETAKSVVEALRRNEREVVISKRRFHLIILRLFQLFPHCMQNFFRDRVFNESRNFTVKGFDLTAKR